VTSAVVATAYVREEIDTPIVVGSQTAQAICRWGQVAVGIAFSNQPVPLSIEPAPVRARASVAGGLYESGINKQPVAAIAISQQSDTVVPPSPGGEQLTFYWG
jgi:hypothetical protein